MDAVMQAKIRAFDEFSTQFKRFQQELRNIEKAEKGVQDQTKNTNTAFNSFLQTVGDVGALYAFQAALTNVMATGRQFELMIKQAQAVTGDFSTTLRDMAMQSTGGLMDVHTPTQLAEAYRELGAAGADVNDIIAANGDILEFGVAAMLDTEKSAYAVLAAQKSFNIAMEDTARVVDAYTQAMNQGALAGQDFQWIMSSAGAVANMAGQQFEQILSIGSAMKDAGIQAQDGGTAIKSALMALMNPSDEARAVIKDLGLEIYDASGTMKQWSDIVKEFEQALGPYNDQAKQMIMGTIFGSDGIRAMAVSLNKGSEYLAQFTEGLKNADGATEAMASTMADSYDGAIRRVNASLERAKILMFESFATAAMPMLEAINTIIVGFNNLDPAAQRMIVLLVGAGGLVFAITAVARAAQMLGITMAMVTGPIGLTVAAIAALTTGILAYKGAQEIAIQKEHAHVQSIQSLSKQYEDTSAKLAELKDGTDEKKKAQEELNKVIAEIGNIMPGVVNQWNSEGQAISINTQKLRENTLAAIENQRAKAQTRSADLQRELSSLYKKKSNIDGHGGLDAFVDSAVKSYKASVPFRVDEKTLDKVREGAIAQYNKKIKAIDTEIHNVTTQLGVELDVLLAESKNYDRKFYSSSAAGAGKTNSSINSNATGAGNYIIPSNKSGKSAAETLSEQQVKATKAFVDALTATLYPYEKANQAAANSVQLLATKEQVLAKALKDGNGTMHQAVQLNKLRTDQMAALVKNQDTLHQKAEAERKQLAYVEKALKSANNPEVVQTLRQEMDRLTNDISSAGQEWWSLEEQRLSIIENIKDEERKRWDDSYQKAMDTMRHEVAMAKMSTEQQISYLEKIRNAHKWSQQQMWSLEEDIFRLRQQQLDKYLDNMGKAYKNKLSELESAHSSTIKSLQDQIAALDEAGNQTGREESESRHNDKLAELQDKRRYHELRTGKEHQKAIEDIDKQIAEAKREWELQQQAWEREDQRKLLEDKINEANEAHERERNALEDHYERAKEISEDGIMDIIAMLAATAPEWLDVGKKLIDELISGLESGDFGGVLQQVEEIKKQASPGTSVESTLPGTLNQAQNGYDSPLYTISSSQYKTVGGQTVMWARELGNLLGGLPVQWDQTSKRVKIGNHWFNPLKYENGQAYVGIRDVAEKLGYGVGWDQDKKQVKIYRAALGAVFTKPAYTQIAEAGESEVAMPLSKFQPMMNDAVKFAFASQRDGSIERAAERIIRAIEKRQDGAGIVLNGPLYHSENTYMGDEMTPEITGRQFLRGMQSAARSRGRG